MLVAEVIASVWEFFRARPECRALSDGPFPALKGDIHSIPYYVRVDA